MDTTNRLSNPVIHYGVLALIYGVALLTLVSHTWLHAVHNHNDVSVPSVSAASIAANCTGAPVHTYQLTFTGTSIVPTNINALRCDEVQITNQSIEPVIAAIGPHEHHIRYPGFQETVLQHGQSYSFRLSESGTFPVHDHDNDNLRASLVIKD